MQAVHLNKSGLRHACFPRNLRTVFFETFQNTCSNFLARPIFACFSFLRRCLPFLAHLCKLTFYIPKAYLELSQLFEMELFAEIVKGFQAISIFTKSSIIDV